MNEFLPLPEARDGSVGLFQVEQKKIARVKYVAPEFMGNLKGEGVWQGLQEDGGWFLYTKIPWLNNLVNDS